MTAPPGVPRPLVALSLLLPAALYLAYRWTRTRTQESEECASASVNPREQPLEIGEVQERLLSLKRGRLETLEESAEERQEAGEAEERQEAGEAEDRLPSDERPEQPEAAQTTKTEVNQVKNVESEVTETEVIEPEVAETEVTKTKVEAVFACTDIRYRNQAPVEARMVEEVVEHMVIDEELFADPLVEEGEGKVPCAALALSDPLCLASPPSPHSYSSSPVKSEASSGGPSTQWSDLIEQDERENFEQVLSSKLSGLELGARTRGGDSGVVSPSEVSTEGERERVLSESHSKTRSHSGEDAGIGSEQGDLLSEGIGEGSAEDSTLMSYQFHIPDYLCGKLIGQNGTFIKKLKEECRCNITLKEAEGVRPRKVATKSSKRKEKERRKAVEEEGALKVCSIEGTRASIDKCLDIVKQKFAGNRDELSFEQTNSSASVSSMHGGSVSLALAEGCMHEVFVSSIVGGGHVFLQQPYHPTFHALERLDACMNKVYSTYQCPALPSPVALNTVCVAAYEGGWYRCQVVSVDESSQQADIKYLDYGGYHTIAIDDLKQIRTDFLSLPFQAIECYLANISPKDDENVSAFVLEELVAHQIVQARMIGTNEQGVPMIHLYRAAGGQTTMVNKELVDKRCASWIETTIVQLEAGEAADQAWVASGNFQSMSLLPDPSSQVNPIFHLPGAPEGVLEGAPPEAWQEQYRAPTAPPQLGDFWQL